MTNGGHSGSEPLFKAMMCTVATRETGNGIRREKDSLTLKKPGEKSLEGVDFLTNPITPAGACDLSRPHLHEMGFVHCPGSSIFSNWFPMWEMPYIASSFILFQHLSKCCQSLDPIYISIWAFLVDMWGQARRLSLWVTDQKVVGSSFSNI